MRSFRQLALVNLRLFLREPVAMFFTLAFPPMMVLLFGDPCTETSPPPYWMATVGWISLCLHTQQ
jgi:hypothetical protein